MANPRNVRRNLFDTRESHSRTSSDAQDHRPSPHHRRLSSYGPQESRISLADRSGNFVNPYESQNSRMSVEERRRSWISFEEPNESGVSLIDHRRISSYDTQDSGNSGEFDPYKLVEASSSRNSWVNPYEQQTPRVPLLPDTDRRAPPEVQDSLAPPSPGGSRRPRTISASSFRRSWPAAPDAPAVAVRPTRPPPQSRRTVRRSLPSSPQPPTISSSSNPPFVRSRLNSAPSTQRQRRVSDVSRALSMSQSGSSPRGSMILYRHAGSTSSLGTLPLNPRPRIPRQSLISNFSRESVISISTDSKYPLNSVYSEQGLIAYAYDPLTDEAEDELEQPGEDDMMLGPTVPKDASTVSVIGVFNILTLIAMTLVLLTIFVIYPVIQHHQDSARTTMITDNTMVNSSGQVAFALPGHAPNNSNFVDPASPQSALSFLGTDNHMYDLIFSHEFNSSGWTFGGNPNVNPTDDLSFVIRHGDSSFEEEITLSNGSVVFHIDASATSGQYISGVLDSQIPFCLGRGFVEMGLLLENGTRGKLFWANDAWYHADSAPDNLVPAIADEDVTLSLSFGILADTIPNGTPKNQLPSSVAIDFVRFYDRRTNTPGETPDVCDVAKSVQKHTTLNLLNLPGIGG